jgi:diguanylate cyclase (GGDEF)-like protein/PAS domain S-box-containing protein
MPLRRRLFWLFVPLLALTLLIVYGLSERILLERFEHQDHQTLEREARQLHHHIDSEIGGYMNMLRSYAWWDDSYRFMQHKNGDFIQHQLHSDVLIALSFHFMFFINEQGQIVGELWAPPALDQLVTLSNEEPRSLATLRLAILQRSRELGALEHGGAPDHALAQLSLVQGVPSLLLSSPISNTLRDAPPIGSIVAGHLLDAERLQLLQSRSQAQMQLQALSDRDSERDWQVLPNNLKGFNGGALLSKHWHPEAGLQRNELLFRNNQGENELSLLITLPRMIYQEGHLAIRFFLVAAVLVTLSASALLYLGLEYWVLRRVQRMHEEIAVIGHAPVHSRLQDQGNDELGALAGELNQMLDRLQQSEVRDQAILDSIQDGYFEIDTQGRLLKVNRALSDLLGYPQAQLLQLSLADLLSAEQLERAQAQFLLALEDGTTRISPFSAPFKRADGSQAHCEIRFSLIIDNQGQLTGYHGILRDVSEQMAYQQQLREQAYLDPLTDLGNRKAFAEELQQALEQAQQRDHGLALLYLDLDRFKEVNDRFGHDLGDTLLLAIAERMRNTLRQSEHLYRLGGDEFTLLMPGGDAQSAGKLGERLIQALSQPFDFNGTRIDFVTPSIGIALYPEHADSPSALINAADQAMYRAKQVRNSVELYSANPVAGAPLSPAP